MARRTAINRRRFLVGLGGITVGLPWLSRFARPAHAAPGDPPTRLIMMTYGMGTASELWRPPVNGVLGGNTTLPTITSPVQPFLDRALFVSNCDMAVMRLNRQHAFGHPAKKEGALTGTLMREAFSGNGANTMTNVIDDRDGSTNGGPNNASVCHFIGGHLRQSHHMRDSIDLGIDGRFRRKANLEPSNFFFEGPANPVSMQSNPGRAFYDTFGSLNLDPAAAQAMRDLRKRNKSVLDAVRGSFRDLRQGLDAPDRALLDDHGDRIRELEIELETITCAEPSGIPNDGTADFSRDNFDERSMLEMAGYQTKIMAHAMACDLAPIGRLEFTHQHGPRFGVPSVDAATAAWYQANNSGWHAMVHGDPSPIDGTPTRPKGGSDTYAPFLVDGYRFFVEQYAGLLTALDAIPEGPDGESVLDHTLVVLASDYGNGNGHSSNKTNWLLAGNTGSARSGYHLNCGPGYGFYDRSDYHTNELLTSIINMFDIRQGDGSPVNSFGLEGFSEGTIGPLFG